MAQSPEKAKLRWRCRRGMRELDALLIGWLDTHHANADDQERHLFGQLLEMQDPEIMGWINGTINLDNSSKDSRFETIIKQIRTYLPS